MTRYKASIIHFLGSALVLFSVFALVRWIWYPGRLFDAASGADLITIIVAVDLIVGPLITLIIFNPGKKTLKFDIACILVCQIGFMLYGAWSIFNARPVYIAFVENRFHLVTANEIEAEDQEKARNPAFRSLPLFGPIIVGTKEPDDPKIREQILFSGIGGMGIQNLPQYFIPYEEALPEARSIGKMVKELKGLEKDAQERLLAYEREKEVNGKKVRFMPLKAKRKILYVAVDASTGAVVEIL